MTLQDHINEYVQVFGVTPDIWLKDDDVAVSQIIAAIEENIEIKETQTPDHYMT